MEQQKTKLTVTPELRKYLVDTAKQRENNLAYKGKKAIVMQHEFILGAVAALDFINTYDAEQKKMIGESILPPDIFVDVIRGEKIKEK